MSEMKVKGTDLGPIKMANPTFMKYFSERVVRDAEGESWFISCNEAVVRGGIEAGVRVVASFPGSPIIFAMDGFAYAKTVYPSMYVEWSSNEQTSFEVAQGAAISGLRGLAFMKQVGCNYIVDPMVMGATMGMRAGGAVVVVTDDDPDNETTGGYQDVRRIPQIGHSPVLEPSTLQEVKDYTRYAFDLSSEQQIPVFVRVMERNGYGRELVTMGRIRHDLREKKPDVNPYNPEGKIDESKYGRVTRETWRQVSGNWQPIYESPRFCDEDFSEHVIVTHEDIMKTGEFPNIRYIQEAVNKLPYHKLMLKEGARVGVITANTPYLDFLEALDILGIEDEVSVLKTATGYPLPVPMVERILGETDVVCIFEEMEPIIEEQVLAIAGGMEKYTKIVGKLSKHVRRWGHLDRDKVASVLAEVMGKEFKPRTSREKIEARKEVFKELPIAYTCPANMCAGCPEYAALYDLKAAVEDLGIDVYGCRADGCSLAASTTPVNPGMLIEQLGGIPSLAQTLSKIDIGRKPVMPISDASIFHHGLPAISNAVFNKGDMVLFVLDNGVLGMTGHNPHPGTGQTVMGEETKWIDIAESLRGVGVDFVEVIDPFKVEESIAVIKEALQTKGVSAVVARRGCSIVALRVKGAGATVLDVQSQVDREKCVSWNVETSPCQYACPARQDRETINRLIKVEDFRGAMNEIRKRVPLPGTIGRVCFHPCETDCKRAKLDGDEAISNRALTRFVWEWEQREGVIKRAPVKQTLEERVAIVGSGPAGLTVAHDLVNKGYGVTIYEALPFAGGMAVVGIPKYRLPREVLQADIDSILDLGVEIKYNTRVGRDLTFNDLFQQGYKAICVAIGAHLSAKLQIPGVDLDGVLYAISFMNDVNLGKDVKLGKKVLVIGGGNVAIDVARSARRLAEEVHLACLETREQMPAHGWEVEEAENEGIKLHNALCPTEILGKGGKVKGVEFVPVKSLEVDSVGRIKSIVTEMGQEVSLDADTVIIAVGQSPDLSLIGEGDGLKITDWGTFDVDSVTLATNKPGIFACSDCVSVRGSVIEAIAAGHEAAESIDRYLNSKNLKEGRIEERKPVTWADVLPQRPRPAKREPERIPMEDPATRVTDFREVELGFTEKMAIREASRCLRCKTCNYCLDEYGCSGIRWVPNERLRVMSPNVELSICGGCTVCTQVCPYGAITEVKEGVTV